MIQRTVIGFLLFVAAVICSTTSAHGQWYVGPQTGVHFPGYQFSGVQYGGYGFGHGIAQTPFSAGATGMGNLIRAEGEYNLQTSQARINYEQARSQYIDNQQKFIAARQTAKRLAQAEDAKDLDAALASRARAEQFIAAHKPQPLSYRQLDPATGQVQWPIALMSKDFEELRTSLNSLFQARLKTGSTADVSQIQRKVGEMKDALRAQILNIPLTEYSEARRFLESMAVSVN